VSANYGSAIIWHIFLRAAFLKGLINTLSPLKQSKWLKKTTAAVKTTFGFIESKLKVQKFKRPVVASSPYINCLPVSD
jgi:hypothetical protein